MVEKVVELSESEYARFYQSPLAEYDFISKHRGAMRQDADGTRHCLLVLGENQEDGILVDAEGYDYARYHAFLPKARQLYLLDQYPTIAKFNQEIFKMAVELAVMMNVVAANNNIDPVSLERLRGECVKEVKRLNGAFSFDDAVSWQNGWEEND